MTDDRDPVERALVGSRDLYDIATWEERTPLDAAAVRLHGWLLGNAHRVVVFAAVLILVSQAAIAAVAVVQDPTLGVLVVLSAVPALLLAGYIWYGDPSLRQPAGSLVVTFVLGVLFAGFAAVANTVLGGVLRLVPVVGLALFFFLVVGPVEEVVKWLAVRVYAYRCEEFRAVVDGAVYGAVAGLGFATIENLSYITRVYLTASAGGGNVLLPTVGITGVRALAGPGHVVYSAFAGYYLGLAKFNPQHRGPIVVKGLLVAALLHGLYNTLVSYLPAVLPLGPAAFLGLVVVYDGLLLYLLFRKLARYRRAYHEAHAGEG